MENFKLNTIEEALADFKEGKFLIVVDDEDRENEGDFITAAEMITPEKINFMLTNGRGVLCAPITISRSQELTSGKRQYFYFGHSVYRYRRQTGRMYHRCFRSRPCRNHQGFGRSEQQTD